MKTLMRFLIAHPVTSNILTRLEQNEDACLLRVLTYHRVDETDAQPHLSPAILSATPQNFEVQMAFIRQHYTPISIYQLLDYVETGNPLPPRSVLVTFDDAYQDFAEHAWGILKTYQIPVVLFVPTAFPDHPERGLWWDRLYNVVRQTTKTEITFPSDTLSLKTDSLRRSSFKRLRAYIKSLPHEKAMTTVEDICTQLDVPPQAHNHILGWDSLRQLAREGVVLGAHTRTHPLLNQVTPTQAYEEAVVSLRDLEREIGEVPPVFAYPSGGFTPALAEDLEGAGFKVAFTTQRGINNLQTANPLLLKRINIGSSTSLNLLRVQLQPLAVHLDRVWRE